MHVSAKGVFKGGGQMGAVASGGKYSGAAISQRPKLKF